MPILNGRINKYAHWHAILAKLNTNRADELETLDNEAATPAKRFS